MEDIEARRHYAPWRSGRNKLITASEIIGTGYNFYLIPLISNVDSNKYVSVKNFLTLNC